MSKNLLRQAIVLAENVTLTVDQMEAMIFYLDRKLKKARASSAPISMSRYKMRRLLTRALQLRAEKPDAEYHKPWSRR